MDDRKKTSKAAFNQQAPTYDNDMRGQHARSLYPDRKSTRLNSSHSSRSRMPSSA